MRRIAANYVYPVKGNPIRNGIVEVNDRGIITKVYDFGGEMVELAHTEFLNGVLVPGFINMHTHLELSYLKREGKTEQGLAAFIDRMIKNAQTEKNINEILKAAKKNDEEMYRKGTIAVADISNTDITTDIKRNSRIKYHTFIEISGLDENTATIRFQKGLDLIHKFQEINLECSLVPHAPYSIGLKLWEILKEYYNKNNAIISIHNQESQQENNLFENGESKLLEVFQNNNLPVNNLVITGQTSVQSIIKFLLDSKILFVHNTFIKNSDIDIIKKLNRNKCGFVICPSSNLFIENKMPPVEMLYESGTPVMIGTDSLASGSSMSVFDEIKLIQNKTNIRFETILKSATLNAAEFMNWNNLGSFERGKKPGINLIQNFDFENMKLKDDSRIKKII